MMMMKKMEERDISYATQVPDKALLGELRVYNYKLRSRQRP